MNRSCRILRLVVRFWIVLVICACDPMAESNHIWRKELAGDNPELSGQYPFDDLHPGKASHVTLVRQRFGLIGYAIWAKVEMESAESVKEYQERVMSFFLTEPPTPGYPDALTTHGTIVLGDARPLPKEWPGDWPGENAPGFTIYSSRNNAYWGFSPETKKVWIHCRD